MLTHVDTFTGIGGFSVALKGVSKAKFYCDIDPTAQTVLRNLMRKGKLPTAPIVEDIKDLSKAITGKFDILTSGFPCTGLSACGLREAFNNPETALFFHIIKIARTHRPPLIFLENVPLVTEANALNTVVSPFVKMGYSVRWTLVPAYAVGLPHKRMRWFCVCYTSMPLFKRVAAAMTIPPKRKEPVRNVPVREPEFNKRCPLWGMSLVPACAVVAIKHMASCEANGCCQYPIPTPPDLGLVIKQGSLVIRKNCWPTARTTPGSCRTLTPRVAKDLSTANRFEVTSTSQWLSCAWMDWFMGYPHNWTALR